MNEKIKAIILLIIFVVTLIGISIFLNKRNTVQHNEVSETNIKNDSVVQKIIEVDDNNFEEEVINSDKKVLVDFYATWCGPCKILEPTIESIANEYDNIKVVQVDVDICKRLVLQYGIQYMPTLIVIENGKEVKRSIGVITKEEILDNLEILSKENI